MGAKRISELPVAVAAEIAAETMLAFEYKGEFRKISARDVYNALKASFATPNKTINLRVNDAPPTDARRQCGHELPSWITDYAQPQRAYIGPVSPHYGTDDLRVGCGGGISKPMEIKRHFVVRSEGSMIAFVTEDEWNKLKPHVPIYGERIGDRMVVWDRIIDENNPGRGGYREYFIRTETLTDDGYTLVEPSSKPMMADKDQWFVAPPMGKSPVRDAFVRALAARRFMHIDRASMREVLAEPVEAIHEEPLKPLPRPDEKKSEADFFPRKIGRIDRILKY